MTLTAADVAEIMRIVEQSTFDELTLEIDGIKLTLRRAGASGKFIQSVNHDGRLARDCGNLAPSDARAAAPGPLDASLQEITSPMLGTFYRAPKPGSAPFVEIGSMVDEDSVVGIIEVMKLHEHGARPASRESSRRSCRPMRALVEFGDVLMRAQTDA